MSGVLIKGELGRRDLGHGATAGEDEDRHGVALVQAKEHEDTSDPRAGSPGQTVPQPQKGPGNPLFKERIKTCQNLLPQKVGGHAVISSSAYVTPN